MNKLIRIIIIILMAKVYTVQIGLAQKTLSLEECKAKALSHNQTIKLALSDVKVSEAAIDLSRKAPLPTVDIKADYRYNNDPLLMVVPAYELPTVDGRPSGVLSPGGVNNLTYHNTYNAGVGLNMPLYLGGQLKQAKKIASFANSISEENLNLKKTDVLVDIERKYWSLVSLYEQKSVIERSITLLTDVIKHMDHRFKTGIVTKNEVLKTQVELNNIKLALIEIENGISLTKMAMNQSMGEDLFNVFMISDSIVNIPEHLASVAFNKMVIEGRSEIKILNNQTKIANAEVEIVKASYKPQVISFANYKYQNPNHLAKQDGETTWDAGFAINIPLVRWGEKKSKKIQKEMEWAKAEYALEQTKEFLSLEVQQAILKLKESITKVGFTKEALKQADENLRLETNRIKEGVSTSTELLEARLQWQKSYANFISAKASAKINEALYYKSIGETANLR